MPFFRFEQFQSRLLTPHLSTGSAPVIEGGYMYFCLLHKEAGTGSELHYHPNELLIFPISGRINAIVGRDRRIVGPGTFVHCPSCARHSMKATEDGPVDYLYIKDLTWTVVGIAANEAVPDSAMSVEEANRRHLAGEVAGQPETAGRSQAIVEGLPVCYYPMIDSLTAPPASGTRSHRIEGERLAFELCEAQAGYREPSQAYAHEAFLYVIQGELEARSGNEAKRCGPGDIMHVTRGTEAEIAVTRGYARFARVSSTAWLEAKIDGMTPDEAARARATRRPN